MNKIAELNVLKEMLANEYLQKAAQLDALINQAVELQKRAALEEMVKQAVSIDAINRAIKSSVERRAGSTGFRGSGLPSKTVQGYKDISGSNFDTKKNNMDFLPMHRQVENMLYRKGDRMGAQDAMYDIDKPGDAMMEATHNQARKMVGEAMGLKQIEPTWNLPGTGESEALANFARWLGQIK